MLMIKTSVKPSTVPEAGLGLFAAEFIPKGTVVWRFCPNYDLVIPKDDLLRMSEASRRQFLNYCYFDKNTKHFILCGDDERFINHSKKPNIIQGEEDGEIEGVEIAAHDIKKGEELFCDYYSFDADADRKLKKKDFYSYLEHEEAPQKLNIFKIPAKIISLLNII